MKTPILFITGNPSIGKSTLANAFVRYYGSTVSVVATDALVMSIIMGLIQTDKDLEKELLTIMPGKPKHLSISKFLKLKLISLEYLIRKINIELAVINDKNPSLIIIEGQVEDYFLPLQQYFNHNMAHDLQASSEKELFFPCDYITISPERNVVYQGKIFNIGDAHTREENEHALIDSVREQNVQRAIENLKIKDLNYQNFSELTPGAIGSSKSNEKFILSKLESLVKDKKTMLDIGCNAGYFCFQSGKVNPNLRITGVDVHAGVIEQAKNINRYIYFNNNINFLHGDFLAVETLHGVTFDFIMCFSTFHYFREQQLFFLEKCHRMLTDNGTFLLEVELSNRAEGSFVDKIKRGVDSVECYFPSKEFFENMIKNLFTIQDVRQSSFQKGSVYNRYFYELGKK